MKGLELPISTVVIIVIVLIVLLAMIAFLFGVYGPGTEGVNLETAKNNACRIYITMGCQSEDSIYISNFDADKNGVIGNPAGLGAACGQDVGDNLAMLCECYYAGSDCINVCGCNVTS